MWENTIYNRLKCIKNIDVFLYKHVSKGGIDISISTAQIFHTFKEL